MSLKQRIARLEKKTRPPGSEFAHLTDDALRARAVTLATELQASGLLDPETAAFLKVSGLWFGDEPPPPLQATRYSLS